MWYYVGKRSGVVATTRGPHLQTDLGQPLLVGAGKEWIREELMAKREWIQPQLIVLARGTPEESVLQACKIIDGPNGSDLITDQNNCTLAGKVCGTCQPRGGS